MFKDLLQYRTMCKCVVYSVTRKKYYNRFFQFHDSTHGIAVIPIGWEYVKYSEVYVNTEIPFVIQFTVCQTLQTKKKTTTQYANVHFQMCTPHTEHTYVINVRFSVWPNGKKYQHQNEKWNEKLFLYVLWAKTFRRIIMHIWVCFCKCVCVHLWRRYQKRNHIHNSKYSDSFDLKFFRAWSLQFQMWKSPAFLLTKYGSSTVVWTSHNMWNFASSYT